MNQVTADMWKKMLQLLKYFCLIWAASEPLCSNSHDSCSQWDVTIDFGCHHSEPTQHIPQTFHFKPSYACCGSEKACFWKKSSTCYDIAAHSTIRMSKAMSPLLIRRGFPQDSSPSCLSGLYNIQLRFVPRNSQLIFGHPRCCQTAAQDMCKRAEGVQVSVIYSRLVNEKGRSTVCSLEQPVHWKRNSLLWTFGHQ